MNWIRDILWRWESRRWRRDFCRAQARACSDADLRWFASGNGLIDDVARREMVREARHRRLEASRVR